MKIFMFAASLRQDSVNKKLIRQAAEIVTAAQCQVDLADFAEFNVPLYHGDIDAKSGLPEGALAFITRMHAADAMIIASPEYNFSIPGTLKNLIDWVSRQQPMPFADQQLLLLSASPSLVGGNRGLWHTRVPFEQCGTLVYPTMFSLSMAYEAFTEAGKLKDPQLQQRLQDVIEKYLLTVKKIKQKC